MSAIRSMIEAQLEVMSPRDKRLLAGLAVFIGVVALGLLTTTLIGIQSNMESRVREAKRVLAEVQSEQALYDKAAATLAAQESRLRQFDGQALSAYVEQVAEEMGIKDGLRDAQRLEQVEEFGLVSTKWRVSLKGRTYDECVRFVHRLESSNYPLRIETTRLRQVNIRREKAVDLTLEVITFRMTES